MATTNTILENLTSMPFNASLPNLTSESFNITVDLWSFIQVIPEMIKDQHLQYVYTILMAVVCAVVCLFSIVTNIINIVIFGEMKFKDTINRALLGLAISDLCSAVFLLWSSVCFNPLFMNSGLPILTIELQFKTGGWTHIMFTRVSAFITMYITLERCLCVSFPLKVKRILTPTRVTLVIVGIYVFIIGTMSINLSFFRIDWKFVPRLNRTMLGMVLFGKRKLLQDLSYYLSIIYLISPFIGVVMCSGILIRKLTERRKWLNTTSNQETQDAFQTKRDQQVMRMIICVAIIFIITFIPSLIHFVTQLFVPGFIFDGKHKHIFLLSVSILLTSDAVNAGLNMFVYLNMSSKYASVFRSKFRLKSSETKE